MPTTPTIPDRAPLWVRICCRLGLHLSRHAGAWATPHLDGRPTSLDLGWVCDGCGHFHPASDGMPMAWTHAAEVAPLWGGRAPGLDAGIETMAALENHERARLSHDQRRALRGRVGGPKVRGLDRSVRRCPVCSERTMTTPGEPWRCATPELHPGGALEQVRGGAK